MATFEKRPGAPAGAFTIIVHGGTFLFDDDENAEVEVTDYDAVNNLNVHPWVRVVGGTETTTPFRWTRPVGALDDDDALLGDVLTRTEAGYEFVPPLGGAGMGAPNTRTESYTLTLVDAGKAIEMNSTDATTVTVPANDSVPLPIGSVIEIYRLGTGPVTVVEDTGVTIWSVDDLLGIGNQYSQATLRKRATNEWTLVGDLVVGEAPVEPEALDPTMVFANNAPAAMTIPTPDASGQVVEPCVEFVEGGWNGHEWWANVTGYTNGDASTENPSIYFSDDGQTWTQVATAFPIEGAPAAGHNADPELRLGPDGNMHAIWMQYNNPSPTTRMRWSESSNGTTWSTPVDVLTTTDTVDDPTGPVLLYGIETGKWTMWYVDTHALNGAGTAFPVLKRTCDGPKPDGPWSAAVTVPVTGLPTGREPFEMHVERAPSGNPGELHFVCSFVDADTGGGNTTLHFGVSTDNGASITFDHAPLLAPVFTGFDQGMPYRGDLSAIEGSPGTLYGLWYSGRTLAGVWGMGYTTIQAHDLTPGSFNQVRGVRLGELTSGGGTVVWSGAGQIATQNANRAQASALVSGSVSRYITGRNPGHQLPGNAVITGIGVRILRSQSAAGQVRDSEVKLMKGESYAVNTSVVQTTNKAATSTDWPVTTDAFATYGGPGDLWGTTWTRDEVMQPGFGVAISATNPSATSSNARIDFVETTIYYTVP